MSTAKKEALGPPAEAIFDLRNSLDWLESEGDLLKTDKPIVRGHMFFPDSEWALTAISQAQFWRRR